MSAVRFGSVLRQIAMVLLLMTLASCNSPKKKDLEIDEPNLDLNRRIEWPNNNGWKLVAREDVSRECGLDPELLELADSQMGPEIPYAIVRYGKLCHEHLNTSEQYKVQSITKFLLGLVFGVASKNTSLSDASRVDEYLSPIEMFGINPDAQAAHVLAMTSTSSSLEYGKKADWSYDIFGWREIGRLIPMINKALEREPDAFPGVVGADELAQKEIFDKLGMNDSTWDGTVEFLGGDGMVSTVRDMARLGLMALREGRWKNEQIISREYMYRAGHPSFEDVNTGWGYLWMMNARSNAHYSSGSPDDICTPVSIWNNYPHEPFYESPDCNGGNSSCSQVYDVGVKWASGAYGQRIVVHPGLDLVMVVRDDVSNEGHTNVWSAIRPALVKMDKKYAGDEEAFCDDYGNNRYAPDV